MTRALLPGLAILLAVSGICAAAQSDAQPPVSSTFQIVPLPKDSQALRKTYSAGQLATLEKLNRRDLAHLLRTDPPVPGLVTPAAWPAPGDAVALSPLPETLEWAAEHGKTIVVHQPWQAFAAYENGQLVRWGPVSTGRKETPTPSGLFHLTWRSKGRHSTDNAAWFLPWYFNFHNERGVSFHQFDLPGYPASHACVRLLERDAKWLYDWGEQWVLDQTKRHVLTPGTPVLIVGEYDYGASPPWVDVNALSTRLTIAPPPR